MKEGDFEKVPILMGRKKWREFVGFVSDIAFVAGHILYTRTKGKEDDEIKAYKTTSECQAMKILATSDQLPFTHPTNARFRGKSYGEAINSYWNYLRLELNIPDSAINTIQSEYDKFSDAARQAGQGRTEQEQAIKAKLKRIGK
jgi:hypothetical protein